MMILTKKKQNLQPVTNGNGMLSAQEHQTKTIAFCGYENNAFVYFTALILRTAGKRVLVIDNSRDNSIYNAVSAGTDEEDIIRQNIVYIKNRQYHYMAHSIFDYIIIWQGMEVREKELKYADIIFLLPSYEPESLKILSMASMFEKHIAAVFMVNSTNHNKINDIKIAEALKINKEKILSVIPYDMKDYEAYLSFLYNGYHNIKDISADYSMCIKESARLILGVDKKEVKKLISKTSWLRKDKA